MVARGIRECLAPLPNDRLQRIQGAAGPASTASRISGQSRAPPGVTVACTRIAWQVRLVSETPPNSAAGEAAPPMLSY